MQNSEAANTDFLDRITEIIRENISDERFGVSELAGEIGMSRSNLLRKIKKTTGLSASQFISQVRLKTAMEMLKTSSYNVSEISYQVGFSSTSYFIKCFREFYGYPPGEAGKREEAAHDKILQEPAKKKKGVTILISVLALTIIVAMMFTIVNLSTSGKADPENSIAVLPFKNDSQDSSNVYLINGLMESLLNNLQQIEDLRVVSRTSVEKYRDQSKTAPEIAKELGVKYIVEGSGQKIGDQIMLNIQLIEARRDKHLWAQQFNREAGDIFNLQREVANSITNEIKVIITPEEKERINKPPTDNLIAYDYFLKGYDLFHQGTAEGLWEAIPYFEKAIEYDDQFARAIADISISYSMLDFFAADKQYIEKSSEYADRAFSIDSKIPQSLIAKALIYMNTGEAEKAVPYLERALKYNPNSPMIINFFSDLYANHIPDTEKYLEYALMGTRIDIAGHDSSEVSFIFMHLSNAFIQSGFLSEAILYIDKALEYDPENTYAQYVKPFILFARDQDLDQMIAALVEVVNKDMSRFDILQEVGKIYYYKRDFENAYTYYKKFLEIKEALNLDVYRYENAKIGFVMSEMGFKEQADLLFNDYWDYAENNRSSAREISLAMYYSHQNDTENALKHLKLYSMEDDFNYWILLFLGIDPLVDPIKDHPEYKAIFNEMEKKFWERHDVLKASLKRKGLI